MKRIPRALYMLIGVTLVTSTLAHAQGNFGVGVIFGEPTGFSWKYRVNHTNALAGALGFSPFDRYRFHVDYLWHADSFNERQLRLYYGVGGAIGFGRTEYFDSRGRIVYISRSEPAGFGVRAPIGLSYMIPRSPVELMLEAAPLFIVAPAGGVGLDIGLGARIYP